jgi:hypothetical protein
MITIPGFLKDVFEIREDTVVFPEKEVFAPAAPGKRENVKFVAPSTSVLAIVTYNEIKLVIGRKVSEQTLKNVLGFGIKNKKPLTIWRCEALSNLQAVDRMVVLCNYTVAQQQGITDDIPKLYNNEEENT